MLMYLIHFGSKILTKDREGAAVPPHVTFGIKDMPIPAFINPLTVFGLSLSNTIVGTNPAI